MDVQTIFYTLGIIFMVVMLLLLIGVVVLLFYIKIKITQIHRQVVEKIDLVNNIVGYTGNISGKLGTKMIAAAADKVNDLISSKIASKSKRR